MTVFMLARSVSNTYSLIVYKPGTCKQALRMTNNAKMICMPAEFSSINTLADGLCFILLLAEKEMLNQFTKLCKPVTQLLHFKCTDPLPLPAVPPYYLPAR
jgi:hypothetical protein